MRGQKLPPLELTQAQRDSLVALGSFGAGASFDMSVMSRLFDLGLVEVRISDRRLGLTERGQALLVKIAPAVSKPPG